MKAHYDWKAHPEIPALLDRAVADEAERLIRTRNAEILQPLALYLGMWKPRHRANCCGGWWSTELCASRRRSVCGGSASRLATSGVAARDAD
jgi:hypothetical protein